MPSILSREKLRAFAQNILTNPFLWGGVAALLFLSGTLYLVVDEIVMPAYTRHGTAVEVPNVQDTSLDQARRELEALQLRVEEQEGRYNPNIPQNAVVDQSPVPGTPIKPGRRVYLTLNRGETPTVVLPDLSGTSRRLAQNRLEGRGLTVNVEPDSLPSRHEGVITRQSPAPGDTVDVGSTVSLLYGTGLGDKKTAVPAVSGRSVAEARALLERQRLRPIIVQDSASQQGSGTSSSASGDVAQADDYDETELFVREQGTSANTQVRTGTEIRLYVTPDSSAVHAPTTLPSDSSATDSDARSEDAASTSASESVPSW